MYLRFLDESGRLFRFYRQPGAYFGSLPSVDRGVSVIRISPSAVGTANSIRVVGRVGFTFLFDFDDSVFVGDYPYRLVVIGIDVLVAGQYDRAPDDRLEIISLRLLPCGKRR